MHEAAQVIGTMEGPMRPVHGADAPLAADPHNRAHGRVEAPPRVLVVDDNEGLAEVWSIALSDEGYEADVVHTIGGARDALSKVHYDLALLDLQLPDGRGTDLLAEIKRLGLSTDCILVTGHTSADSAIAALNQGACAYLTKPVPTTDVIAAAGRALQHRSLLQQSEREYRRERRISETLQRSFLPTVDSPLPALQVATFYHAALDEARVGGDFYDLFPLSPGRIAFVLGDVSGKGLQAARHTAMLRYALRAYAALEPSPAAALERLGLFAYQQTSAECFATLFYGVIDTENATLAYANAGHEPALLFHPDAPPTALDATGTVIGALEDAAYRYVEVPWPVGSLLFLYTDGITEASQARLLDVDSLVPLVERHRAAPTLDAFLAAVHAEVLQVAGSPLQDDVALLALRSVDPP